MPMFLLDLCHASLRHAGINPGGALAFQSVDASSTRHPLSLRQLHHVRRYDVPVFCCFAGLLRRICILTDHVLCKLPLHYSALVSSPLLLSSPTLTSPGPNLQLPSIMWLMIYRPSPMSWSWITNWVLTKTTSFLYIQSKDCKLLDCKNVRQFLPVLGALDDWVAWE